jgi:hypothetical protein
MAPLGLYVFCVVWQTAVSAFARGVGRALAAMPLLVVSHLLYGFGFWRGLFTRLDSAASRARAEVVLENITGFETGTDEKRGSGQVHPVRGRP